MRIEASTLRLRGPFNWRPSLYRYRESTGWTVILTWGNRDYILSIVSDRRRQP
jgi:hypothetical protein